MVTALLILLLSALPAQAGDGPRRQRAAEAPPFLTKAWLFESADLTDLRVAADAGIAVVPLADGKLVALDPLTGNVLWTAEPGGSVSAPPLLTPEAVYVATSRADGSGVLRALDRSTGVTLWVRELARPVISEIFLHEKRLYLGSADNSVYSLRADNGATVWAFATRGPVRGQAVLRGNDLLIGSDDGALYALNRDTGAEVWRFQTAGPVVGRPAFSGRMLFVTSGDGQAYAIDGAAHRVFWKQRTGAAIEAGAVVVSRGVLVSSFDNFVYLFDGETGDRVWKRRMRRRLVSEPVVTGETAVVAPLRDNQLSVVSLKDGKRVGAFALENGDELVAPPTFVAGGLVLMPTPSGLLAARPASTAQTVKESKPSGS
jgi:eukaryotic-like serine/threonine-protein kinase